MGLEVTGVRSVEEMLISLDSKGKKRVVSALYKAAQDTMRLARAMAPVDEGNLEKAIKISPTELGRIRDEYGRFARTEIEVYIDMNMPIPERPGKTVGDYAYEIHEQLTPYGFMQLGPKSQSKQARSGIEVGGGFLDRAAAEIEKGLDQRLRNVLDELGL